MTYPITIAGPAGRIMGLVSLCMEIEKTRGSRLLSCDLVDGADEREVRMTFEAASADALPGGGNLVVFDMTGA